MTAVSSSIVGPAPGSAARLDSQRLLDLAGHLQAVADPTRLRLLAVVLAAPAQTACVRDITTTAGLAQPMDRSAHPPRPPANRTVERRSEPPVIRHRRAGDRGRRLLGLAVHDQ